MKFYQLGKKLFNVGGAKEGWTDTMTLTMVFQTFVHYLKIGLKIYKRAAKNLSFLQADVVSYQNIYTGIPLADTDALKL